MLFGSRIRLLLSVLVDSMSVTFDEVLRYVIGPVDSVICLLVGLPSHQIPKTGARADVMDNSVHELQVLGVPVCLF